eukprot:scaffold103686_cov23-Tisochrysis_lutea.AAC.1
MSAALPRAATRSHLQSCTIVCSRASPLCTKALSLVAKLAETLRAPSESDTRESSPRWSFWTLPADSLGKSAGAAIGCPPELIALALPAALDDIEGSSSTEEMRLRSIVSRRPPSDLRTLGVESSSGEGMGGGSAAAGSSGICESTSMATSTRPCDLLSAARAAPASKPISTISRTDDSISTTVAGSTRGRSGRRLSPLSAARLAGERETAGFAGCVSSAVRRAPWLAGGTVFVCPAEREWRRVGCEAWRMGGC